MNIFNEVLKRFLHDPVNKALDILTHEQRAKEYAEILVISQSELEEAKGSDWIASSMEISLLPKGIKQPLNEIRHPLSEAKIDLPDIIYVI
jgi:CRISPR-associated protein Cmr2